MKSFVWTEKRNEGECLVSSSLRTVLFLSRLVGIAPVWFRKQDGWRIRVSPVLCIFSFVIITVLNACTLTGLAFDLQEDLAKAVRGRTNTRRACWVILVALVTATASVAVYSGSNRIMVMIKGLDEIQKINKTISTKYAPRGKEKKKNIAIVISVLIFLVVCISDYLNLLHDTITNDKNVLTVSLYFCYYIACLLMYMFMLHFILIVQEVRVTLMSMNAHLETMLKTIIIDGLDNNTVLTVSLYFCYYIACLLMYMFMLHFILIVQEVRVTLMSMNAHLETMLKTIIIDGLDNNTEVLLDQNTKTVDETIRNIYLKYGAVCNVIEKLNISYGPTVFTFLITSVAQLILSPYLLVNDSTKLSSYLKVAQFVWSGLHSIRIFVIIEPCHLTHREMARSSILVSKLIITRTNMAIFFELEKFARFLLLNQISYSPIGLCTLSRSFLATIISGVVTYLVLLIQFQTEETM